MQKSNPRIFGVACILVAIVAVSSLIGFSSFIGASAEKSPQAIYHQLYGSTPIVGGNYSFSPPVSKYRAINIALGTDGWNASSLENMTLYVSLNYDIFYTNVTALYQLASQQNITLQGHPNPDIDTTGTGFELVHEVTASVSNYQPQIYSGVSLRYIWTVAVEKSGAGFCIPPPLYYVDAATAEVVPVGLLI